MPAKFIELRAVELVKVNDLVVEQRDPFGERYLELMENPKERDPAIMRDAVGYLAELYIDETGDVQAGKDHAADLASFVVLPFSVIASVPMPVRGTLHSTGAALVSAIASRQAFMELVAPDALTIGTEMGRLNKAAASRMTTPQKEKMSTEGGIKKTIAEIGTEKPDAGS